jgi:hypothetical protein
VRRRDCTALDGADFGAFSLQYVVPVSHVYARLLVPADQQVAVLPRNTTAQAAVREEAGLREHVCDLVDVCAVHRIPADTIAEPATSTKTHYWNSIPPGAHLRNDIGARKSAYGRRAFSLRAACGLGRTMIRLTALESKVGSGRPAHGSKITAPEGILVKPVDGMRARHYVRDKPRL